MSSSSSAAYASSGSRPPGFLKEGGESMNGIPWHLAGFRDGRSRRCAALKNPASGRTTRRNVLRRRPVRRAAAAGQPRAGSAARLARHVECGAECRDAAAGRHVGRPRARLLAAPPVERVGGGAPAPHPAPHRGLFVRPRPRLAVRGPAARHGAGLPRVARRRHGAPAARPVPAGRRQAGVAHGREPLGRQGARAVEQGRARGRAAGRAVRRRPTRQRRCGHGHRPGVAGTAAAAAHNQDTGSDRGHRPRYRNPPPPAPLHPTARPPHPPRRRLPLRARGPPPRLPLRNPRTARPRHRGPAVHHLPRLLRLRRARLPADREARLGRARAAGRGGARGAGRLRAPVRAAPARVPEPAGPRASGRRGAGAARGGRGGVEAPRAGGRGGGPVGAGHPDALRIVPGPRRPGSHLPRRLRRRAARRRGPRTPPRPAQAQTPRHELDHPGPRQPVRPRAAQVGHRVLRVGGTGVRAAGQAQAEGAARSAVLGPVRGGRGRPPVGRPPRVVARAVRVRGGVRRRRGRGGGVGDGERGV